MVVVVVVVGAVVVEVFVVVVSGDVAPEEVPEEVLSSLDDVVVPDVDVPDVVVPDVVELLAPGCSRATTTPISAIAPAVPRTADRVTRRKRSIARPRASGEFDSFDRFMNGDLACSGTAPIPTSSVPG